MPSPWTHRRTQLARERTGAPTGRGGRLMTALLGRSKPSATAMGMSMTMLIQRICRGVRGTPRGGGWAHDGAAGPVETERDRDGDVDDHVDPEDLQGGEGDPAGDGEDPGPDEVGE